MFGKKGVLRNLTKFTGKHLCQNFFFNKVACLRTATLLKKKLWHRCFPENFVKFLRTPFLTEHMCWLLLLIKYEGKKPYFCIKILITLFHVRKITSFKVYIFRSPRPLLFLFHFRGRRCFN